MKVIVDDQGDAWVCDEEVKPDDVLQAQGCWSCRVRKAVLQIFSGIDVVQYEQHTSDFCLSEHLVGHLHKPGHLCHGAFFIHKRAGCVLDFLGRIEMNVLTRLMGLTLAATTRAVSTRALEVRSFFVPERHDGALRPPVRALFHSLGSALLNMVCRYDGGLELHT